MKTEITTLFEQLLLPKLLPCRFISTFIYTQREKNGDKKVDRIPYFVFCPAFWHDGKRRSDC